MKITMTSKVSNQMPDIDMTSEIKSGVSELNQSATQLTEKELYETIIQPIKRRVVRYNRAFDRTLNNFLASNSMLQKMLEATKETHSRSYYNEKKDEEKTAHIEPQWLQNDQTKEMIHIMNRGHDLLLNIREQLTGQEITTKFLVKVKGESGNDEFYEIDEKLLRPHLTLSTYGSNDSISNPFSLAYEIDREMLKSLGSLSQNKKIVEVSGTDVWEKIWTLKGTYLENKKRQFIDNNPGKKPRDYKPFFDSKDAEIFELFRQNENLSVNDLDDTMYAKLRASMGGGGGYASPFYKIGDIGLIQMKYVNLANAKTKAVNFTRLSIVRDRLRLLEEILSENNAAAVGNRLLKFFTEKSELYDSSEEDRISREVNEKARIQIMKMFNL